MKKLFSNFKLSSRTNVRDLCPITRQRFLAVLGMTVFIFVILNTGIVILSKAKNPFRFLSPAPAQALTFNSSNTSASNLKNGLVGWWTMDGVDMAATQALDKSGNNKTGTLNGGVTKTGGKIGQAMKFDGSSGATTNIIVAGISSTIVATGTYALWVKPTTLPGGTHALVTYGGTNYTQGNLLSQNGSALIIYDLSNGGCGSSQTKPNFFVANQWVQIVLTSDISGCAIYRNGVKIDSGARGTNSLAALNFYIGGGEWTAFNGSIDDVRIYNRVLSPTEILELYAQGGGKVNKADLTRAQLKTGLVGWWTMDGMDVSGRNLLDKSVQGNNGTLELTIQKKPGKLGQGILGTTGVFVTNANMPVLDNFTFSLWAKRTASGITYNRFIGMDGYNFEFALNGTQQPFVYVGGKIGWTGMSSNASVLNAWEFWTITRNGALMTVYKNGKVEGSTNLNTTTPISAGKLYIGRSKDGGSDGVTGIYDDVRVYNRALSPVEILELYAQGGGKVNKADLTRAQLKTGLVAYWTFDGMDWASSLLTLDKSGNSNTGTLVGGVTKVSGKIGQGVRFNGTTGMVNVSDSTSLSFGNGGTDSPFSISMWVKPTVTGSGYFITKEPNTNSSREWLFGCYATVGEYFSLYTDVGGNRIAVYGPCTSLTAGKWHYVVATYDGSKSSNGMNIYIDNVKINNATDNLNVYSGMNSTNSSVIIGAGDRQTFLHNGSIDEVRIYNRELSLTEITELFKMGK